MNGNMHTHPATPSTEEISRYLKMGASVPADALAKRICDLQKQAAAIMRPTHIWGRFPVTEGKIGSRLLGFSVSGTLAKHLDGCREAYLACGTIGAEFDAMQRKAAAISASDALIVQAIGTAMIEKWMDFTESEIHKELREGEHLTSRYSPGYGDLPIESQHTILNLLDASRKIGVSLTGSLMMVPSKSVSAVIGVRRNAFKR